MYCKTKLMKKISLFVIVSLITTHLIAQIKIAGTVKDNKSRPVPGVSITLKDTYDGATTDSSGSFTFVQRKKGNILLSLAVLATTIMSKISILLKTQSHCRSTSKKSWMN